MAMTPSLGWLLKQRELVGREVDRSGQQWSVEEEREWNPRASQKELSGHTATRASKFLQDSVDTLLLRHPAS